jgi:hypothetical protein
MVGKGMRKPLQQDPNPPMRPVRRDRLSRRHRPGSVTQGGPVERLVVGSTIPTGSGGSVAYPWPSISGLHFHVLNEVDSLAGARPQRTHFAEMKP